MEITQAERDEYGKEFKILQADVNGKVSIENAIEYMKKFNVPAHERRHLCLLCDVTRDGALSLTEFTAAIHLVNARRYNMPLPATLPTYLHAYLFPIVMQKSISTMGNNSGDEQEQEQEQGAGGLEHITTEEILCEPGDADDGCEDYCQNVNANFGPLPNAETYENRFNRIIKSLCQVSFEQNIEMTEILLQLRQLRRQTCLLLGLCNDLSDELLYVQTRKASQAE